MFDSLLKNDFVKSVSVLMTGTVFAQIINYAFTPIIARIFTVEEMADLNLFFRINGFIVGFATLRYEMSLPLPKSDSHSFLLYRISVRIALVTILIVAALGLGYLLLRPFDWFNVWFLSLVLIGSFFLTMTNLGTNWSIRNNTFRQITQSRIVNSLSSNILRTGFGWIHWGSFGLILGTVIGYILSSWAFIREYLSKRAHFQPEYSKRKQYALVKEYKQFPLINMPHSLSDLGRDLLLATLIVWYFGKETFGYYSYAIIILTIPVAFIGVAISQVFYNRASILINEGKSIFPMVRKSLLTLLLLSIIPFTILYLFSEQIFVFVFGSQWRIAGVYSSILVIYNFFNFLVSPLSNLSLVLNRQKEFFISALTNSSGQIIIVLVSYYLLHWGNAKFSKVLWLLTIFQSVMMMINIFLFLRYAKKGRK